MATHITIVILGSKQEIKTNKQTKKNNANNSKEMSTTNNILYNMTDIKKNSILQWKIPHSHKQIN